MRGTRSDVAIGSRPSTASEETRHATAAGEEEEEEDARSAPHPGASEGRSHARTASVSAKSHAALPTSLGGEERARERQHGERADARRRVADERDHRPLELGAAELVAVLRGRDKIAIVREEAGRKGAAGGRGRRRVWSSWFATPLDEPRERSEAGGGGGGGAARRARGAALLSAPPTYVEPVPLEVRLELGARRRFHAHDLVHLRGVGASEERENESVRDRSTLPLRDRLTDCEYGGERATGIARLKQQQQRPNLSPTHRKQSRQSRLILATRHTSRRSSLLAAIHRATDDAGATRPALPPPPPPPQFAAVVAVKLSLLSSHREVEQEDGGVELLRVDAPALVDVDLGERRVARRLLSRTKRRERRPRPAWTVLALLATVVKGRGTILCVATHITSIRRVSRRVYPGPHRATSKSCRPLKYR